MSAGNRPASRPHPAAVQSPHPSLTLVKAEQDPVEMRDEWYQGDKKGLESLEGWDTFTFEQKLFLMVLPVTGVQTSAAKSLGYQARWPGRESDKNPLFKAAIAERLANPSETLNGAFYHDIWTRYLARLAGMASSSTDTNFLTAIKLVAQLAGVTSPDGDVKIPLPPEGTSMMVGIGWKRERQEMAVRRQRRGRKDLQATTEAHEHEQAAMTRSEQRERVKDAREGVMLEAEDGKGAADS